MLGCTQLQALNFVTARVSGGAQWEWDRLPWCPRGRCSERGAREVLLCAEGDRTLPGVFWEDARAAWGRGWVLWCGMGSGEGSELCPEQQEGPDGVSAASSSSFLLPSDVCVFGSGLSACWGGILPWSWDPLGSF